MSSGVDIQSGIGGVLLGAIGAITTLYASFANRKTNFADQLRQEQAEFREALRKELMAEREERRRERDEFDEKIESYELQKKADRHFINNLKLCLSRALTIMELPEQFRRAHIEALKQKVEELEIHV